MAAGPSKEDLEMYWQNSRQYFDELARHYEKADPAYYKEYIQPFYSNPFRSKGSGFNESIYAGGQVKKSSGGGAIIAAVILIVLIGLGSAAFILMKGSSSFNDEPTRLKEKVTADTVTTPEVTEPPPVKEQQPRRNMNFLRGQKMFEDKYYEQAEKYLKRVPETDPDYKDAQRLLEIIKTMNKQKETGSSKNKRVQPFQPVR